MRESATHPFQCFWSHFEFHFRVRRETKRMILSNKERPIVFAWIKIEEMSKCESNLENRTRHVNHQTDSQWILTQLKVSVGSIKFEL